MTSFFRGTAFVGVALLAACTDDTTAPAPPKAAEQGPVATPRPLGDERLILAFGDSLYAGFGLGQGESLPARLESELRQAGINASVVNAGVSGDTSAAGRQRLAFTLDGLKRPPDLVILGLGGNDAFTYAFSLVPKVLETERRVSKKFSDSTKYRYQNRNGREVRSYTRDFALAYGKALSPMVNDQAKRSANQVADFWYTAWVDAGKPDLKKIMTKKWTEADEQKLQDEIKAYRKNELLKNGWLVSRKDAGKED